MHYFKKLRTKLKKTTKLKGSINLFRDDIEKKIQN